MSNKSSSTGLSKQGWLLSVKMQSTELLHIISSSGASPMEWVLLTGSSRYVASSSQIMAPVSAHSMPAGRGSRQGDRMDEGVPGKAQGSA
jgi:hypothetical protein